MSFVLISFVDPLESNYREHGRARSWLSPVKTPALISSAAKMDILKIDRVNAVYNLENLTHILPK